MSVEVEHIFPVPGKKGVETAEVTKINPGPSQDIEHMSALQINVLCDAEDKSGELSINNKTLPEDLVSVTRYPLASSIEGIPLDFRQQIRFSLREVIEITSKMYSDRLRISHRSQRPTYLGNLPPKTPA